MEIQSDPPDQAELAAFYRAYLQRCNEHDFDRLDQFVADDVEVNGLVQGLTGYVRGLQDVIRAFPDYHWDLAHLLVHGSWISAHFLDTGTHRGAFLGVPPTGRTVRTQEFAIYRVEGAKFVEVWVAADNLSVLDQLRRTGEPSV